MKKTGFVCVMMLLLVEFSFALEVVRNEQPIYSDPPVVLETIKNGVLQEVGGGEDKILICHVWGTPHEMGLAAGTLLKKQIEAHAHQITTAMASKMGGDVSLLDEVYAQVKPYIPDYFHQELEGLAEGSGLDLQSLIRVNMIGEASEWNCSLFGAYGKATESTGNLLQLRALDYEVKAGIQNNPVIMVYHPNEGNGHAYANFTWAGSIGAVTGISSEQLAISEIGDDYDKTNDTFDGYPFMILLRDILQFDKSLDEATKRICGTKRTTSLMYAVGDGQEGKALSYQTSRTLCNVFNPDNLQPLTGSHERIPDIVYWGMSWDVPAFDKPLHDMLQKHYGKLTGEVTVREILPTVRTGNLQVAVYDLTDMVVWTANARGEGESGPLKAYERAYVRLEMNPLFGMERPKE